ncbi:hypothetical protein JT05_10750 [Desulfosporosinus sp. Tol-M]|nr:hypothetical protein JT05_10750 [Desulfosporosinus sp. Tol-M]
MNIKNQVYNGDFLLSQEIIPEFPDGWVQKGGDTTTRWEWLGPVQGPRAIAILHPGGQRAGIAQALDTTVQAGEIQRWEVKAILETEPAEVASYIKVFFGAVSQKVFSLTPGSTPEVFSEIFATPVGTNAILLEIGIIGEGKLVIHEVEAYRLYPNRVLRLDEKGQVYARHVDSIGQIQMPVSVKVISPVPIHVDVSTFVTADIRNLTPTRDGVRIYGSTGTPVNSTFDGLLQVQMAGHVFRENVENVVANIAPAASIAQDVSSLNMFSFAVSNSGATSSFVQLQISPDGLVWSADTPDREVKAGTLEVFTPSLFLRYNRLVYRASVATPLKVWFQAQS